MDNQTKKSKKRIHILDLVIPLAFYIGSEFFLSSERSLLIAMFASALLLIIETNWEVAFRGWFVAIILATLAINLSVIILIPPPEEFKIALALGPIFILEFIFLYWIVNFFKRRY